MPECQAFGCSLRSGQGEGKGLGFYVMPNPIKKPALRELAGKWLHFIGTGFTVDTFKFGPRKLVCERHFRPEDFTDNAHIRMSLALGLKPKYDKVVKHDVWPTIFVHRPPKQDGGRGQRAVHRENKKIVHDILSEAKKPAQKELPVRRKEPDLSIDMECDSDITASTQIVPKMVDACVQTEPVRVSSVNVVDAEVQAGEMRVEVNRRALRLDHAYSAPEAVHISSTPKKKRKLCIPPIPAPAPLAFPSCTSFDEDVSMDESRSPTESLSFDMEEELEESSIAQDPHDKTYQQEPSDEESEEMDSLEENYCGDEKSMVDESKYVVFDSSLEELCRRVRCPECDAPADETTKTMNGSAVQIKVFCIRGHVSLTWDSQPVSGKMPLGNLLLAGGLLFSGATFSRIHHMASLINLKFISKTTFNNIQREHLMPAVSEAWKQEKEVVKQEVMGKKVQLCGDGRCDSPGYSAKYCSYTLMDMLTNKIINLQLVQVTETGSSSKMEVKGYERALDEVKSSGIDVNLCATDRHVQVRKLHKDKYLPMGIQHQFDVYHLAVSVRKKIRTKAKKKKFEKLMPWVTSVVHHLWWCAASCGKDPDVLVAKWESVTFHVTNVHAFPENKLFPACAHAPIPEDLSHKKKWLVLDSPAHKALVEVVLNPRLLKDIRQLAQFCHTGMLEVYHNLVLKYAPKRLEFDYPQMITRLQLAALDHNANVGRAQATITKPKPNSAAKGELQHRTRWSKATERWIVEPVKEAKSYNFATDLLESVVSAKKKGQTLPPVEVPASIPRNIAKRPMPCSKQELIDGKKSRY